jgi:hypothetical protein
MNVITKKSDVHLPAFEPDEKDRDNFDPLEEARRMYGQNVYLLTVNVLKRWANQLPFTFVGLSGQSMYDRDTDRKKELTIFKCVRVPSDVPDDPNEPDDEDEFAPIILDSRDRNTEAYVDLVTGNLVTGSGSDPMFYFKKQIQKAIASAPEPVEEDSSDDSSDGWSDSDSDTSSDSSSESSSDSDSEPLIPMQAKMPKADHVPIQKKFKSTTNETRAELLEFLLRRRWEPSELYGMSLSQLRTAVHVSRTWGLRDPKVSITNESSTELRAFLKGRMYTNEKLRGLDKDQLRKLVRRERMKGMNAKNAPKKASKGSKKAVGKKAPKKASKGSKKASKGPKKAVGKKSSKSNETKLELIAMLKRRGWASKMLANMTIHQMRVAAQVDRTWGVRDRKVKMTNETKAELRAFLKGRKYTNEQLSGLDLLALRKLANRVRMTRE